MLQVQNIEKYYGSQNQVTKALDRVSFTVEDGAFIAIMGASGSGKTTLLNCISTIDTISAGDILLDGQSIAQLSPRQLAQFRRERLGFVFQDFLLHLPLILLLILFVCKLMTLSFIICTEAPLYLHAIRYGLVLSCFLFRL